MFIFIIMTFSFGVFLTLLTFITTGFVGSYLGCSGTNFFIFTGASATVFINTWNLYYVQLVGPDVVDLGEFFSFYLLEVDWFLIFDFTTCLMIWLVSLVSASIQLFSCFYMRFDPYFIGFIARITFFTFCMLLFISSGDFIFAAWGWEGVGICSCLLLTFWYIEIYFMYYDTFMRAYEQRNHTNSSS